MQHEIVEGTVVGAAALEKELRWGVCKELEVEVADSLVPNELGAEQDDVLASSESWLAEVEERELEPLGREVYLPSLTFFGGFEAFDVKEPRTGQKWGISEV